MAPLLGLPFLLAACTNSVSAGLLPRPLSHRVADEFAVRVLHGPDHSALVIAAVTIDGRGPYPFVLDTGAAISAVSTSLVKRLGLPTGAGPHHLVGAGCSGQSQGLELRHWSVGGLALPSVAAATVSFPAAESSFDGLLGSDALRHLSAVTIDYATGLVKVGPAAVTSGIEIGVDVLSSHGETLVVAPVHLRGATYPFVIDTGASESAVAPALVKRTHLSVSHKGVSVSGVSCTTSAGQVELRRWSLGTEPLPAVKAVSVSLPVPTGLVGSNILSQAGTVTIDYARHELFLAHRP